MKRPIREVVSATRSRTKHPEQRDGEIWLTNTHDYSMSTQCDKPARTLRGTDQLTATVEITSAKPKST